MTNENESTQSDETPTTGQRPIHTITGSGGLRVAVWKNKGEHGDFYNAKIERRYMNSSNEWQSTDSLRADDLLRTAKLIEEADQWIEQDKQKQRGLKDVSAAAAR